MNRWTLAAAAALLSQVAFADPPPAGATRSVALPTGVSVQAEVVTAPAEGTVEHAIVHALTTIIAGDFGTFMSGICDPETCADPRQQEQLTTYNLPAAQRSGASCLHGEANNEIVITRRRDENGLSTLYLFCGEGRMPAPSTWKQVDGTWKTSSFSW